MKYAVTIVAIVQKKIFVEADNPEEAQASAEEFFSLRPDEHDDKYTQETVMCMEVS